MDEGEIFYGILTFMVATTAWELFLTFRQIAVYKSTTRIPPSLAKIYTEDKFEKSRQYSLDRTIFRAFAIIYGSCTSIAAVYKQSLSSNWDFAGNLAQSIGFSKDGVYGVSICFSIIGVVVGMLFSLPPALYSVFIIEEKHEFNNQTLSLFLKDYLKSVLISAIIGPIMIVGAIFIINNAGNRFYIWLWLFSFLTMVLMQLIAPIVILPLFVTFTPLEDGELRRSIQEMADKVEFPLDEILVMDSSRRSGHENAMFTGLFGVKRIILFDTLLKAEGERLPYENGEILAILCHELGHWKHGHTYSSTAFMQIVSLISLMIFGMMMHYSPLYRAFGFAPGVEPTVVGLIIIKEFILAPYYMIASFLMTFMTRKFEYEADEFAVKMNFRRQLKTSLVKAHQNNLQFPVDDWLYAMSNIDHPTLLERLEHIDAVKTD